MAELDGGRQGECCSIARSRKRTRKSRSSRLGALGRHGIGETEIALYIDRRNRAGGCWTHAAARGTGWCHGRGYALCLTGLAAWATVLALLRHESACGRRRNNSPQTEQQNAKDCVPAPHIYVRWTIPDPEGPLPIVGTSRPSVTNRAEISFTLQDLVTISALAPIACRTLVRLRAAL